MGIVLICITILLVISNRRYYEDARLLEVSTKCFVVEKGINSDRTKYIIVNHYLIEGSGNEEKIEVESEMVWNLIEENQEYRMTYKIYETQNELAEIWRVPEFD